MSDEQFKQLTQKLDILIRLTAMNSVAGKSLAEQVELLTSISFRPSEIAEVLGRPLNIITATLSNLKRKSSKTAKEEQ